MPPVDSRITGHAGHGRPPAALAVGVQQGTQAVAPRGLVLRVDPFAKRVGHRVAHPAVAPGRRPVAQQPELARRVAAVGRLVPVGPRMRDHAFAFGIEDLHLQGPQADDHLMAGVFGSGRVPVAALDGDVAVFVGLHPRPRDHVERLGGQGQQRLSVLVEQAGLALALPVVVLVPQFEAAAGQAQVEAVEVPYAGHRHEQPAAHGPDPGLDAALLVSRVRVAERVLEPVVRLERLEQAGQADPVEPFASDAGGVVIHDAFGHPAQPFE